MTKRHLLLALLSVILWGINFPLIKFVFAEISPLLSVALRLLISSVVCLPFVTRPKNNWGMILLLSITLFTLTLGTAVLALKEVDASIAALMTELEVPFAAILSYFILKEKFTKKQLLGTIIAFVGVYLIAKSPEILSTELWPIWLLLVSAFFYALSAIMIKFIKGVHAFSITVWSSFFAAPQLFVLSFILEDYPLYSLGEVSQKIWVILTLSAAISILAFFIWNHLIGLYQVNQIVPFGMLIPLSALVASYFILGETTHSQALVGGVLALTGVYMQAMDRAKDQ